MPVFITFEPYLYRMKMITTYEVARDLFISYLRSFLAFRHRRPELHRGIAGLQQLRQVANETQDEIALELLGQYDLIISDDSTRTPSLDLAEWAIHMPRATAGIYDIPTAVFIDEFQLLADVYDPDQDQILPITNYYQKPSESLVAPLVVTGSSVSLLLGRGHWWGLIWALKNASFGSAGRGSCR